jgi:hypothetical protein
VPARRLFLFVSLTGAVCAAGIALADPPAAAPRRLDITRVYDAGGPPPGSDMVVSSTPADPPAMHERVQWVFDLRFSRDEPYLLGMHRLELGSPQATPRVIGRFAVELYEGPALIERVRFDFPMLGAAPADSGVSLERNLTTRIGVMFPATRRGTRLELWDRATDRRWALPWPPTETRPAAPPAGSAR